MTTPAGKPSVMTPTVERSEPIDVWILGGYLGAGKTTMLNALLRSPRLSDRNPALIINEFGRIGVDGALVEHRNLARYEINKGSLFCACTRTDFVRALESIADAAHRTLFIEATGVAEPVDIEDLLVNGSRPGRFRLCGNICVVDASGFTQVAAFLKPAVEQVRWADTLVINKCDLVDDNQLALLRRVLTGINQTALLRETTNGQISIESLLENERKERNGAGPPVTYTPSPIGTERASYPRSAPSEIFALAFTSEAAIEEQRFSDALSKLGDHILRLKGNVGFSGGLSYVEMVCGKETRREPVQNLSDCFTVPTVFTVIAWNTTPARVRSAFARCGCIG